LNLFRGKWNVSFHFCLVDISRCRRREPELEFKLQENRETNRRRVKNMSTEEIQQYWQRVAAAAVAELECVIHQQRNEMEGLQQRCQQLAYEKTMQRAAIAYELRETCQAALTPSGAVAVPALSKFIELLGEGLVPPIDDHTTRKRCRETPAAAAGGGGAVPNSPVVRAMQRMMYLQRRRFREDDESAADCLQPRPSSVA
jgi:hypothetical protein